VVIEQSVTGDPRAGSGESQIAFIETEDELDWLCNYGHITTTCDHYGFFTIQADPMLDLRMWADGNGDLLESGLESCPADAPLPPALAPYGTVRLEDHKTSIIQWAMTIRKFETAGFASEDIDAKSSVCCWRLSAGGT
jgi:hypothetical protein